MHLPLATHLTAPASLVHLDRARKRFGTQQVELLIELMYQGDPLADALIQETDALGVSAKEKIRSGIQNGLVSLESPPPALQTFLESTEQVPEWVVAERLKRGSDAYNSIGDVWITLSLGPGSLAHTYSSPSIAKVLVKTGNLTKMARRRIIETGVWNIETTLPGGLERGAKGYIHNLQVRLLHARVRANLLKQGWDRAETGLPINQVEMVRTWLDFTYVPLRALQQLGLTFTDEEFADLYHFWRYVAYLLGIDDRLIQSLTDQQSAHQVLDLIDSTIAPPNEDAKVLTHAMLESVAEFLAPALKTPYAFNFDFASALVRQFHGDVIGDQLGVKRTWVSWLLPLFKWQNQFRRFQERRNPQRRAEGIARTAAKLKELAVIEGLTTYQQNADNPSDQHLPVTH